MITQSFLYNAIYFTYGLVLSSSTASPADQVPLYGLAFAVGNLCGPLMLAPLFDIVGRKPMISGTYIISGVLLAISGWIFDRGDLTRHADLLLDHHLLLRLSRRERRLSHGQRDVADRDPCGSDRGVLRDRADLRSVRPALLRCADRRRHQPDRALHRLPRRGRDHGLRRDRRAAIGIKAEGKSLEDITTPITAARRRAGRPRPQPCAGLGSAEGHRAGEPGRDEPSSTGRASSRASRSSRFRPRARSSPTRPSTTSRARSTQGSSCRR